MRRSAPRARNRPHRLSVAQEATVYLLTGGLALSGGAWLVLHHFVRVAGEFGPEQSPFERPLIILHGVLSFGFLVLAGAILERHVRPAWRFRINRATGIALLTAFAALALTALGLYYLAGEGLRNLASLAHWTVGLVALPILAWHASKRRSGGGRRSTGQKSANHRSANQKPTKGQTG